MNQKEQHCQKVLEELFPGYEFVKIRHPKIKNPETNRPLELDLYNAELQIAIEYNGPQHYYWIDFYHKTKEDFEKQKIRDVIKESYCDILSIQLIDVPNLQKYDEIKEYIIKSLDAKNIEYNKTRPTDKKCARCGIEKSRGEFSRNRRAKNGLAAACKVCELSRVKKFREKFKIKDEQSKIWFQEYKKLNEQLKNPLAINSDKFNEIVDEMRDLAVKIRDIETKTQIVSI
jgi:hypothetical protein